MIRLLTIGVALILLQLVACTSGAPTEEGQPSNSKTLPPLEVNMTVDEAQLSMGTDLPITIAVVPGKEVRHAVGQIGASGVVSLVDAPTLEWNDLAADKLVTTQATFRIESLGEGEMKVLIQVVDESGDTLYGRATTLYFLATDQGIFMGTTSPLLLHKQYLDRALASGIITQQEYDEALDELLGGGATESNEPIPTPS